MLLKKHLGAKSQGEAQQVLCSAKGTDHVKGLADSPHETWGKGLMDKCSLRALATCSYWLAQTPTPLWCPPLDQSLTFSDPMYYSLPGYCIHGIFQARVLEWGAIYTHMYVHAHMYV